MCHLKVILFASGRGSDAQTYRPSRDETQWWNRRDALVRCTAAFLFGPQLPTHSRELILLFDQDWSQISMSYTPDIGKNSKDKIGAVVPTEKNMVSIWKQAASNPETDFFLSGLKCRLSLPSDLLHSDSVTSSMDSKRDVLEHLQKVCTIDFLRNHRLNSSPAVLLRKTNRKVLMKVWGEWQKLAKKRSVLNTGSDDGILRASLHDILSGLKGKRAIVGTLHESSDNELPCWGKQQSIDENLHLVFALGAVRDMEDFENKSLGLVCRDLGLPAVKIRLGSVPEFTSKILSIVALHHSTGVLGSSVKRLAEEPKPCSSRSKKRPRCLRLTTSKLHLVCFVPFKSSDITLALEQRDRVLWALVRVTVVSLWRSRLVGGKTDATSLQTRLTLVFTDAKTTTLEQDSFVQTMAEQHHAAPCEYQILAALQHCIEKGNNSSDLDSFQRDITRQHRSSVLVDFPRPKKGSRNQSVDLPMYRANQESEVEPESVVYFVDIAQPDENSDPSMREDGTMDTINVQKKSFLKQLRKDAKLKPVKVELESLDCQDFEAASVCLLQHWIYQQRVSALCRKTITAKSHKANKSSKKRKEDSAGEY